MGQDRPQTRADRRDGHVASEHDVEGKGFKEEVSRYGELFGVTGDLIFFRECCVIKMELQYLKNTAKIKNGNKKDTINKNIEVWTEYFPLCR